MKNLHEILKKEKYRKIKFKITKTQHLLIKAKINGVTGNFILDTGASNTCVCFENVALFHLKPSHSKTQAAGAGATGMFTQIATKNSLKIGSWQNNDFDVVIFNLSHVNMALVQHKAKPVHGIIGADVLLTGRGIIDYYNRYLYLLR
ncbi:retropepsin-like aspartic protease [Flavobacterium sp. GT3R68]|uniref:retropepsin-like aspartic protease n=1 Tax=Flavobacterium sp. GT3R68 TaxID=2594437 RepID=UPI000F876E00|nr:retropepsin-like aspartic protease [Flavobacterium sp. GT3R68]RTY89369.1 acid protease [Flavobacterium sp. GSN2]TRW93929.1 acid protease [Flavobacterium sp. GT3R68]